ncbi:GNAT family N-acetyltransferase [Moritella sp. Urea-trap-13]|uniref:GNAT family N-acetyltransferase n=1 Tax=Moritella sp. Urea-trap-13 TaxID=2058327 RepID=UPI000C32F48C|nr:GNAT family N-acetyltransferase [Moritella sp. Urea-trap-13]PKH05297.1 femAB family protein [Moritella sp. Urea-trap-13]
MTEHVINLGDDIYYQDAYAALYESNDGELFNFVFQQAENKIIFRSIKRQITQVAGIPVTEELYDLETPYGYGGPLTNCYDSAFLTVAFAAYKAECIKQHIVCEFIRFHPFNPLTQHDECFDFFCQERQVVIVDLTLEQPERWSKYSKTTRNIIRKTQKVLTRHQADDAMDDFLNLYQQTMDKNQAAEFYYFDRDYFNQLSAIPGVELLAVKLADEHVSMGFFMQTGELAHYHLSANNSELLRENGNYALLDFAFERAQQNGCKWMMLGGGRTSASDDSLFKFKTKFSDHIKPFYIAGLDFMPEKRAELNKLWASKHKDDPRKMFQLYRA